MHGTSPHTGSVILLLFYSRGLMFGWFVGFCWLGKVCGDICRVRGGAPGCPSPPRYAWAGSFLPGWPLRPWWYWHLVKHRVLRGLLSGIEGCLVGLILKVPAGRALDPGVQSGRPGRRGLINQSIE